MSARFDVIGTRLDGLTVLRRKPIGDRRGYFERMFCSSDLADVLGGRAIIQINHSLTARVGSVRGLHFQRPPHAEMKFVSCLRGEVLDVAVDLRPDSPTRHQWHAEMLSAENHTTLVIPEGFAHGFQTLSDDCEMHYYHTASFHPESEGGLNPRDPLLAIRWPLAITDISERDSSHPYLDPS